MRKIFRFILPILLLASCHSHEVGFTYSPATPRAGQLITFTNTTDGGDTWSWNFGDGSSSTIKAPTKIYKSPGQYVVSLRVDGKKSLSYSTTITVLDTLPIITLSDTVAKIYQPYKLSVSYYNPYKYITTCLWSLSDRAYFEEGSMPIDTAITIYFTRPYDTEELSVAVTMNGKTDTVRKTIRVEDVAAPSLIYSNADNIVARRRIFGTQLSEPTQFDAKLKVNRLDAYIGTVYAFCDDGVYTLSQNPNLTTRVVSSTEPIITGTVCNDTIYWKSAGGVPHSTHIFEEAVSGAANEMQGLYALMKDADYMTNDGEKLCFCGSDITIGDNGMLSEYAPIAACAIDKINGKIYFIANHKLFISNINGDRNTVVELTECQSTSLALDYVSDCVYYIHQGALYSLPLIHTDRNINLDEPTNKGGSGMQQICIDTDLKFNL